jgi:hypothetical protein
MISGKEFDWQKLISSCEWLGQKLEAEIDLAQEDLQIIGNSPRCGNASVRVSANGKRKPRRRRKLCFGVFPGCCQILLVRDNGLTFDKGNGAK